MARQGYRGLVQFEIKFNFVAKKRFLVVLRLGADEGVWP